MSMKKFIRLFLIIFAISGTAQAQYIVNGCNEMYTQSFNGLATFVDNTDHLGWGAEPDATPVVSNGSSITPEYQIYRSNGSGETSIGFWGNDGTQRNIGFYIRNNSGSPITVLKVTYTGEQWRKGNNGRNTNRIRFGYQIAPTFADPHGTDLANDAAFTSVPQLYFNAPKNSTLCRSDNSGSILNGNASANRRTLTYSIRLVTPILDQQECLLRWDDIDFGCGDHGFSIDDVKLNFYTTTPNATISGNSVLCRDYPSTNTVYNFLASVPGGTFSVTSADPNIVVNQFANDMASIEFPTATTSAQSFYVVYSLGCDSKEFKKKVTIPAIITVGTPTAPVVTCNTVSVSLGAPNGNVVRWERALASDVDFSGPDVVTINNPSPNLNDMLPDGRNYRWRAIVKDGYGCERASARSALAALGSTLPDVSVTGGSTCSSGRVDAIVNTLNDASFPVTVAIYPDPNMVGLMTLTALNTPASFTELPAGTYTVTMSSVNSCVITRTVTVAKGSPNMPVTGVRADQVRCDGMDVTWDSYIDSDTYELSYRQTAPSLGLFQGPFEIFGNYATVSGLSQNATYEVRVRAMCSTGSYSPEGIRTDINTISCTKEVSGAFTKANTALYPNPTTGSFTVKFTASGNEVASANVIDVTGKVVASQRVNTVAGENIIEMNITDLAAGIYNLQLVTSGGVEVVKIIKE